MRSNIFMLINDLHSQIDRPKEFKSGPVVSESHKQSSHVVAKIEEVPRARVPTDPLVWIKKGANSLLLGRLLHY
jgi:hypothetical protein